MKRAVMQFDECKPHWARERGYLRMLEQCGMQNLLLTGDFDSKFTAIYGDVIDFEAFEKRVSDEPALAEGSLYEMRDQDENLNEAMKPETWGGLND